MANHFGTWGTIRMPMPPKGSRADDLAVATAPAERLDRARRRGEASMGVGAWLLAGIIAGGYGAVLWVGLLMTWIRWPLLIAIGFVLWRHRDWVRRRMSSVTRRLRS
jgi:hypothetical protein